MMLIYVRPFLLSAKVHSFSDKTESASEYDYAWDGICNVYFICWYTVWPAVEGSPDSELICMWVNKSRILYIHLNISWLLMCFFDLVLLCLRLCNWLNILTFAAKLRVHLLYKMWDSIISVKCLDFISLTDYIYLIWSEKYRFSIEFCRLLVTQDFCFFQ